MKREEVRNRIREVGIIASIRIDSAEEAVFAAESIYKGGIPIAEIALTVPGALDIISRLAKHHSHLIVGAGSVFNVEMAQASLDAGARFITSDGLRTAVVEFAVRKDIVVIPGALTPSEVLSAWESGCDMVKLVPCVHIGGENYLRSLHRMLPQIPLVAAGGIDIASAEHYIVAGALAIGVGRELIPEETVRHRQGVRIVELANQFLESIKFGRERLEGRQ
jgi:2-dehydro-3-deoxyphosphogluconate aldolase/(4S)-4-hydroxy-2-oxoglutarate aldolase